MTIIAFTIEKHKTNILLWNGAGGKMEAFTGDIAPAIMIS